MRTIITRISFILLLIIGIKSTGFAQSLYMQPYPKWRLGLNGGGTWQTNDVKKNYAGLAGGFNIERILNKKEDAPIGFSLGFRYLSGNSSGYDNTKNIGLKSNAALNGTNDSLVKYDSIPGYFYNNYYTHLAEGDLELKINFPAMEKRSKLIFHIFGGLGFNKYKTRIDALDKEGKMYDYSTLSSNPSVGNIKSFYGTNFETLADRDNAQGKLIFTPSVGLGLGFRLSKNVAFVFEHKVSFPFTNTLDGVQYTNTNTKLQGNDIYHYTSANLIFTIFGKSHSTNYNSNTNTNTNTNVNTNNITNNQPKPVINIYSPTTNPSTSYTNVQQVSGTIQYVNSANNVSINVNGNQVTNYTFNPNNGSFSFGANLLGGTNTVNITATNSAGQDNESITINYAPQNITNPVVTNELPPNVQISYPSNNYSTTSASVNVNATVTNIVNSSNIAISANGYTISNFNFNSYDGSVSFIAPLVQGRNSIIVSAFNNAGNDAEQVFVNYNSPNIPTNTNPVVLPKPVVSFNNPSASPFESTTNTFNITAHVTNVTTASQVAVQYNGIAVTNFTFNQYGFVNFTVNLNQGSNTVVVTGTNASGSDTKTATVNYKEAGFPPVVTLINPAVNPTAVTVANTNVIATVTNVNNQSNISVTVNNVVAPFTYNTANHTVTIPVSLNVGNNSISVSATTNFGNDTKTQIIERKESQAKPVVTIVSPSGNPHSSSVNVVPVLAQVLNATFKQISVVNAANVPVQFTYNDVAQQVAFNANLAAGLNTYTIKATNMAGTDSKTVKIEYKESVGNIVLPKPSVSIVNPGINPFVTSDGQVVVKASTINVSSQQEISVSLNGVSTNFTFNTTNKEIEIPVTLNFGNNIVLITVSNKGGSDSKTQVIEKIKQAVLLPVVTVINPQTSPYLSATPNYTVSAEVLNASGTGISVMQGTSPVVFTYDNATNLLTFTANVTAGSATYVIKGTNQAGSDSKTVTINHVKRVVNDNIPVELNKPVVVISTPNAVNTNTTSNTQNVIASVSNVSNASQVSVLVNGINKNDFTYNNGAVTFTTGLNLGNNTITVTGTSLVGSDSKTVFVLYKKVADGGNGTVAADKPVVNFITPNQLNTITTDALQNVNANVTNVTGASQVSIKVNGSIVNNFTYNNGNVAFAANLNLGNNTVSITGTNAVGSDTKTISILYKKIADGGNGSTTLQKPVVLFVVPNSANTIVSAALQNITATVSNVSSASQVSVQVNGTAVNNFTYNNGSVSFPANLIPGNNTVSITGTNVAGSDSKSVKITYSVKTAVVKPPVVTISTPATSTATSISATQNVVATVLNVSGASDIEVTVNGSAITNFNFSNSGGNLSFTATLNQGSNTIYVKGTNSAGIDSKTVICTYTPQIDVNEPKITICHHPSDGSAPIRITIPVSEWAIHEAHGDTEGNCPAVTTPTVTPTSTVTTNNSDPMISICHYPPGNTSNPQQLTIPQSAWAAHQAHGDVLGTCPTTTGNNNGNNGNGNNTTTTPDPMISICHYPPGNTSNPQQLTIPQSAWAAHQAHGDVLGTCPTTTGNTNGNNSGGNGNNNTGGNGNNNSTTDSDPMISICHYPPGNTNNPQQIQIPASAWPAHQAHGDVLGACPPGKNGNGNNNNNNNGGKTNTGGTNGNGGKTNTSTTPVITNPRTINNNQTTPKKEETVTPPKKTETTSTPKAVTPVTEPKKEEKKKEENLGTPAPRIIKPR